MGHWKLQNLDFALLAWANVFPALCVRIVSMKSFQSRCRFYSKDAIEDHGLSIIISQSFLGGPSEKFSVSLRAMIEIVFPPEHLVCFYFMDTVKHVMNIFSSLTEKCRTKFTAFLYQVHWTLWVYMLYTSSNFTFVSTLISLFITFLY